MTPDGFHGLVLRAKDGDRAAMDAVLAALEPHLRHLARPYADRERPDESTSFYPIDNTNGDACPPAHSSAHRGPANRAPGL